MTRDGTGAGAGMPPGSGAAPSGAFSKARTLFLTTSTHVLVDGYGIGLSVLLALLFGRSGRFALVGLILSAFTLATAFAEPFWGRFSDATGRRGAVVGWGLVFASASFCAFGFVPPEGPRAGLLLFLLALAAGAGAGTYHSVATALVNEVTDRANRGLVQGINNAGGSVGRTLFPLALAELAVVLGSPGRAVLPFAAAGVLLGLVTVSAFPIAPHGGPGAGAAHPAQDGPVNRWFLARMVALSFLRTAFFVTAAGFLPTFLVAVRGLDERAMGTVMTLVMATGVLAQPLGGSLSDRWDRGRLLAGLLMGSGAAFAGFLLTEGLWASVALLGLSMFLVLMTFPLLFALMGDEVPRNRLGAATGLVTGAGGLAATLTQATVGVLAQRTSPVLVLLGLSALGILSGWMALGLRSSRSPGGHRAVGS
ncbi:MAG: MFS transporter [Acidobacteriota bacterium]